MIQEALLPTAEICMLSEPKTALLGILMVTFASAFSTFLKSRNTASFLYCVSPSALKHNDYVLMYRRKQSRESKKLE